MRLSMGASGFTSAAGEDNYIDYKPKQSRSPSRQLPIRLRPFRPHRNRRNPTHTASLHARRPARDHHGKPEPITTSTWTCWPALSKPRATATLAQQAAPRRAGPDATDAGKAAGLGVKDSFQPDENVRGGSTLPRLSFTGSHITTTLVWQLAAVMDRRCGLEAVDKYHGIPLLSRN